MIPESQLGKKRLSLIRFSLPEMCPAWAVQEVGSTVLGGMPLSGVGSEVIRELSEGSCSIADTSYYSPRTSEAENAKGGSLVCRGEERGPGQLV